MPSFLIGILINLVLHIGIPAVIDFLKRRWGISITPEQVEKIILDHQQKKRALHEDSKQKLKECTGIACPSDTKDI